MVCCSRPVGVSGRIGGADGAGVPCCGLRLPPLWLCIPIDVVDGDEFLFL